MLQTSVLTPPTEEPTATSDELAGIKILLVEDDDGHAELIKRNLQSSGVDNDIFHFNDGHTIINFLQSPESADSDDKYLIILDLNMPTLDGFEVLRRVKAEEVTKNIPIIILTTTNDSGSIEHCYELGCNVFITKPVNYQAFSRAIQELGMFLKVANVRGSRKQDRAFVSY